jgi:hypothetical protein
MKLLLPAILLFIVGIISRCEKPSGELALTGWFPCRSSLMKGERILVVDPSICACASPSWMAGTNVGKQSNAARHCTNPVTRLVSSKAKVKLAWMQFLRPKSHLEEQEEAGTDPADWGATWL